MMAIARASRPVVNRAIFRARMARVMVLVPQRVKIGPDSSPGRPDTATQLSSTPNQAKMTHQCGSYSTVLEQAGLLPVKWAAVPQRSLVAVVVVVEVDNNKQQQHH